MGQNPTPGLELAYNQLVANKLFKHDDVTFEEFNEFISASPDNLIDIKNRLERVNEDVSGMSVPEFQKSLFGDNQVAQEQSHLMNGVAKGDSIAENIPALQFDADVSETAKGAFTPEYLQQLKGTSSKTRNLGGLLEDDINKDASARISKGMFDGYYKVSFPDGTATSAYLPDEDFKLGTREKTTLNTVRNAVVVGGGLVGQSIGSTVGLAAELLNFFTPGLESDFTRVFDNTVVNAFQDVSKTLVQRKSDAEYDEFKKAQEARQDDPNAPEEDRTVAETFQDVGSDLLFSMQAFKHPEFYEQDVASGIGSLLGFMVPGRSASKLTEATVKTALPKIAQQFPKLSKYLSNEALVEKTAGLVVGSTVMSGMESAVESQGIFDEANEYFQAQGLSEAESRKRAGKYASEGFGLNFQALMVSNALELLSLGGYMKGVGGVIGGTILGASSEGIEELQQFGIGEYEKRYEKEGYKPNEVGFFDNWYTATKGSLNESVKGLTSGNPEAINSFILGALMGGPSAAISSTGEAYEYYTVEKPFKRDYQALLSDGASDMVKKDKDGKIIFDENDQMIIDGDKAASHLKAIQTFSSLHDAQTFFASQNKEDAARFYMGAKLGELVYNYKQKGLTNDQIRDVVGKDYGKKDYEDSAASKLISYEELKSLSADYIKTASEIHDTLIKSGNYNNNGTSYFQSVFRNKNNLHNINVSEGKLQSKVDELTANENRTAPQNAELEKTQAELTEVQKTKSVLLAEETKLFNGKEKNAQSVKANNIIANKKKANKTKEEVIEEVKREDPDMVEPVKEAYKKNEEFVQKVNELDFSIRMSNASSEDEMRVLVDQYKDVIPDAEGTANKIYKNKVETQRNQQGKITAPEDILTRYGSENKVLKGFELGKIKDLFRGKLGPKNQSRSLLNDMIDYANGKHVDPKKITAFLEKHSDLYNVVEASGVNSLAELTDLPNLSKNTIEGLLSFVPELGKSITQYAKKDVAPQDLKFEKSINETVVDNEVEVEITTSQFNMSGQPTVTSADIIQLGGMVDVEEEFPDGTVVKSRVHFYREFLKRRTRSVGNSIMKLVRPEFGAKGTTMYTSNTPIGKKQWEDGLKILRSGILHQGSIIYYEVDPQVEWNTMGRYTTNDVSIQIAVYTKDGKVVTRDTTGASKSVLGQVPSTSHSQEFNNIREFLWKDMEKSGHLVDGKLTGNTYKGPATRTKEVFSGHLNVNKGAARSIKSFMSKMKKNQVFFGYSKKDNFGTVSFTVVDPMKRQMPITVNSSTPGAVYMFVEDENGKIHPTRLFTKNIKDVEGAKNAILNILQGFKGGSFEDQLRQLHEYVRFYSSESKFSQYTDADGNVFGVEPYFKVDKTTGLFTKAIPFTEAGYDHAMKVTGGNNIRKGQLNGQSVFYVEGITPVQMYDLLKLDERPIQVDMGKIGDDSYMDTLNDRVFSDLADPETGTFEGVEYSTASHSYSISVDPTYYEETPGVATPGSGKGKLGRLRKDKEAAPKKAVLTTDNTDSIKWFKERFEEIGISVDDNTLEKLAEVHRMGGSKIWGVVKDAAVILASDASNTVTRHEAFHVVFRLFLTDAQRSKVLDEAFNKWGGELGIKERSHTNQEVAFKLGGTEYYETLDADSKLEEKLAREFETYKHNTQVMSDEWHAKHPKIAKFFEGLYNFLFDEFDKLKQIFGVDGSIDTLFRRIERDTLGRTLVTNKRRKKISRLITENSSTYSDQVAFSIDGYSNVDVRETAKFINRDILTYILSDEKYGGKTLVELLNDHPSIIAKRELLDEIYSKVPENIDEYKENGEYFTGTDLTDLYEGIKTLFKHPDFKKALYRDLSASRNVAVSLEQLSNFTEEEVQEERPKESWQVDNIRVNPLDGLSAELMEFLQELSRVESLSEDYISDELEEGKQKQIYRPVADYKFTKFGGLQYYDIKQIHTALLNELSDSANEEDMFNRLVEMAKRHNWVNALLAEMDRSSSQEGTHESRIRESSMFKRMYINIGSYTNIDALIISEDPTNKVFSLFHANGNKINRAKARHYISLLKMSASFIGETFSGNFHVGSTKVADIQIAEHLNEIKTAEELDKTLKAFGIETNEFIADKLLANAEDLGLIKKNLTNIANTLERGQTEYEALRRLYENINTVLSKYETGVGQMSFLNVNNEKQYSHIKGGTMNRIMATLKSSFKDAFLNKRKDMVFHRDHPFYDDLADNSFINQFNLEILSGLKKDNSGVSFDFSRYNPVQLSLTNIVGFFDELSKSGKNNRGRFAVPPLGDSPTHLYLTGKVFTQEQIEDKLALVYKAEINRIAYLKANPSNIKNYSTNGLKLIFFKGSDLPTDNSLSDAEVKIAIRKMMNIRFNKYMKKLEKQGLFETSIDSNTGEHIVTPNTSLLDRRAWNNEKDTKSITDAIKGNLRKYYFNQFYYNTGMISLFSGDPAFFKDPVDFVKRFKQIYAPGDYLFVDKSQNIKVLPVADIELFTENLELIEKAISKFDQSTKDTIIAKFGVNPKSIPASLNNDSVAKKIKGGTATAKEHTDFYNKYKDDGVKGLNNITDGQSFQTLLFRKRVLQAQQKWTDKHDIAWSNLENGLSIPEDIRLVLGESLQPQKPFYFDFTEIGNTLIPIQMKDSQTILLPGVVYQTKEGKFLKPIDNTDFSIYDKPELAKALYTAEKTNSDLLSFDSTIKIGLHNVHNFSELSPESTDGFINIPMSGFKIQNNVPEHYKDYKSLIGTQLVALINADPNATSYKIGDKTYPANVVRSLFEETISKDLNEAISQLSPKVRNPETLRKLLIKEALRKRLDDQYIDALRKQDGKNFKIDLYDPMHSYLVESFINSMYKKTIRQKVNGGNLVNVSSVGYEDLDIKIAEDGTVEYVEVAIPAYSQFLTRLTDENGILDLNLLPDKVKNMIGYRIPTEGKYSMFPIKIKHVLPPESGGTIIMPRHITTIAGLDFDIDKMYMLFYALEPIGSNYEEVVSNPSIQDTPNMVPKGEAFEFDEQFKKDVFDDAYELDGSIRSQTIVEVRRLMTNTGVKVIESARITSTNTIDSISDRDQRNNLRMDIMFEVLGKASSDMFNPGNSDILDVATDMLSEAGQPIADDSQLVIGEPSDMESLSMRSAVGGRLIGVFANENKNHALIQGRSKVTLKHGLKITNEDGVTSDKSKISPDDNGTISKNLASLLFASTEHVKNPKLDKVGINEFNVGVVTLLIRLNVPFNTIVAFINQPIIKELNENFYQFKQEGKAFELYEQDKFKDLIVPGFEMAKKGSLVLNVPQLMTFNANRSHTISLFKYLSESAAEMTEFTLLLKPDAGNLGPTLSEVDDYIRRIRRFNPTSLQGTGELIPDISVVMNTSGYSYEITKPSSIDMINSYMDVILSEINDNIDHFPYFSPFFQQVKSMIENKMFKEGRHLSVNDIKSINNQILNYFTLKDYVNKDVGKLLNKETGIAKRFSELPSDKYPVLKSVLTIAMDADTLRLPIIQMADVGSLNPDEVGDIRSEFEDLIFSKDPNERQTGIDLAMFAIYSKGKTFGLGSYTHLIPSSFYTSTLEGTKVQESIGKDVLAKEISYHEMSNIVDRIILNALNRFAPQLFKKEYVIKGNTLTVRSDKIGKVIAQKADINIPFHTLIKYIRTVDIVTDPNTQNTTKIHKYYQVENEEIYPDDQNAVYHRIHPRGIPRYLFDYSDELIIQYPAFGDIETKEKTPDLLQDQILSSTTTVPVLQGEDIDPEQIFDPSTLGIFFPSKEDPNTNEDDVNPAAENNITPC